MQAALWTDILFEVRIAGISRSRDGPEENYDSMFTVTATRSIALIEDNREVARRLRDLVEGAAGFRFAGHYPAAETALRLLPENPPDLVLVDMNLPGIDGAECIKRIREIESLDRTRLVVLTIFEDVPHILRAIENGADGYLLKDIDPQLLLAELHVVLLGGSAMTPRVAAKILERAKSREATQKNPLLQNPLTPREKEVMHFISLGLKYPEIAEQLTIKPNTVRRHIENIYRKLDVGSRAGAIARSRELGLD